MNPDADIDDEGWLVVHDGDTRWEFEAGFLTSHWECIWGRGCPGIEREPAPALARGCCSVGAAVLDEDEARRLAALAAAMDPVLFQKSVEAEDGIFSDDTRGHTRVVGGACVFLNDPGFPGGAGCALHLAADADGEHPLEYKPAVCWQLPLRVDRSEERARVRRWVRDDWGGTADEIGWWCTDPATSPSSFSGDRPVHESLSAELDALLGAGLAAALRARLAGGPGR